MLGASFFLWLLLEPCIAATMLWVASITKTYFFLICLCVRTMYVHTMCGNAGPHMPWHSCRGERTTFGVSGHCPLCFRQGALCLYHCRCRNSWPVSFQDCRLCSHLGAALGSTQRCCVLLCINSDNWSSGAHVYTASTASKEPSLQSSLLLETWSHKVATDLIILLPQP